MNPWNWTHGDGALLATAIHHGHTLTEKMQACTALNDLQRLREEDPFTAAWTLVAPTRVVVEISRFEFDLNRSREKAVYLKPDDAWGLEVRKGEVSAGLLEQSLQQYDGFYRELGLELDRLLKLHPRLLVLDIHSYNYRRAGVNAAADSDLENPEVNVGTGTMLDDGSWRGVIDAFLQTMKKAPGTVREIDTRENVRFKGGFMAKWIHESYQGKVGVLSIEFKKTFMDEWTGDLNTQLQGELYGRFQTAAFAALKALQSN